MAANPGNPKVRIQLFGHLRGKQFHCFQRLGRGGEERWRILVCLQREWVAIETGKLSRFV